MKPRDITVEADWSSISYWYGFTRFAEEEATTSLPNVSEKSLQGDRVIADIMDKLGVHSTFKNNQLILTKQKAATEISWDFKDCPDLAQTGVTSLCGQRSYRHLYRIRKSAH
ncbi:MAG: hypothetical protein U5K54_19000 [Cytophagales bacterium]|nr:hypothetical protein [Cytophagales bacterium]